VTYAKVDAVNADHCNHRKDLEDCRNRMKMIRQDLETTIKTIKTDLSLSMAKVAKLAMQDIKKSDDRMAGRVKDVVKVQEDEQLLRESLEERIDQQVEVLTGLIKESQEQISGLQTFLQETGKGQRHPRGQVEHHYMGDDDSDDDEVTRGTGTVPEIAAFSVTGGGSGDSRTTGRLESSQVPRPPAFGRPEKVTISHDWVKKAVVPELKVDTPLHARGQALQRWTIELKMMVNRGSREYHEFFERELNGAEKRYLGRRQDPNGVATRARPYTSDVDLEIDAQVTVRILEAVPSRIKERAFEQAADDPVWRCRPQLGLVLDEVWDYISPGGPKEIEALTAMARSPGTGNTAIEAVKLIREWRTARKSLVGNNCSDISPIEIKNALVSLISGVKKKHERFRQASQLKEIGIFNAVVATKPEVVEFEEYCMATLLRLESEEESVRTARGNHFQSKELEVNQFDTRPATGGQQQEGPPGGGEQKKVPKPCWFFHNSAGGCSKGAQCGFSHEKIEGAAPAPPPKGKGKGKGGGGGNKLSKKPCFGIRDRGFCGLGDQCPYSHDPAVCKKEKEKGGTTPAVSMMRVTGSSVIHCVEGTIGGARCRELPNETGFPAWIASCLADVGLDGRVLVDSGANEVVRPYNASWWNEVMVEKQKERKSV